MKRIKKMQIEPSTDSSLEKSNGMPKEVIEAFVWLNPKGHIGQPEEIARLALFLASNDSSIVTGIELCVDGGLPQI